MRSLGITLLEILGRIGILLLAIISLNRTTWYQDIPGQLPLNDPFGWMIAFSSTAGMMWIILPIFDYVSQEATE